MRKKIKPSIVVMTLFLSVFIITPTFARPWFGWASNNDCKVVAMPSDSHDISACVGGTQTYYFLGIAICTAPAGETWGKAN